MEGHAELLLAKTLSESSSQPQGQDTKSPSAPVMAQPRARVSGWGSGWWAGRREDRAGPKVHHSDGVVAQDALHAARPIADRQGLAQVLEGGRLSLGRRWWFSGTQLRVSGTQSIFFHLTVLTGAKSLPARKNMVSILNILLLPEISSQFYLIPQSSVKKIILCCSIHL